MNANVVLQVMSGPIEGERFEFDRHDTFLFGRGKDCHAKLPKDGYVSRHHFLLEVNPPHAAVRDLGSLNGTRVNGVRYGGRKRKKDADGGKAEAQQADGQPREAVVSLRDGDRITVGRTTIRVNLPPPRREAQGGPTPRGAKRSENRLYTPTDTEAAQSAPVNPGAPLPAASAPPAPVASPPSNLDAADPLPVQSPADADFGLRKLVREAAAVFQGRQDGLTIEGYSLGEVLGQGAMGTVYHATRHGDMFPVAIKVMAPRVSTSERARGRFLREIDVIGELDHPNIAALMDSGAVDKAFYFVMDFCNGGSAADLAAHQGGRVALQVLAPIMLQTARGLEHAHACGFVHRDLKPSNILLHQQGTGWTAKLGDFGLAKHLEQAGLSGMTLTGTFGGTYDYMPREQLTDFRNARPVSDVWSLAATFYRLLTGCAPRPCPDDRDPMEVVLREKTTPIRERAPEVPVAVARVIDLALAAEPDVRYRDGAALRRALEEVLA